MGRRWSLRALAPLFSLGVTLVSFVPVAAPASAVTGHNVAVAGDWSSCDAYIACLYYDGKASAYYAEGIAANVAVGVRSGDASLTNNTFIHGGSAAEGYGHAVSDNAN